MGNPSLVEKLPVSPFTGENPGVTKEHGKLKSTGQNLEVLQVFLRKWSLELQHHHILIPSPAGIHDLGADVAEGTGAVESGFGQLFSKGQHRVSPLLRGWLLGTGALLRSTRHGGGGVVFDVCDLFFVDISVVGTDRDRDVGLVGSCFGVVRVVVGRIVLVVVVGSG